MSIMQDYAKICKDIGEEKCNAIDVYLIEINKDKREPNHKDISEEGIMNNPDGYLFFSDVIYKETEYKKFEKWHLAGEIAETLNSLQDYDFITHFNKEFNVDNLHEYSRADIETIFNDKNLLEQLINTLDFEADKVEHIDYLCESGVLDVDSSKIKDYLSKLPEINNVNPGKQSKLDGAVNVAGNVVKFYKDMFKRDYEDLKALGKDIRAFVKPKNKKGENRDAR